MTTLPLIIEFLIHSGELTGSIESNITLTDEGKGQGIVIKKWTFPEAQPTSEQFTQIEQSQAFQTYLLNRDKIIHTKKAKEKFDNGDKEFAKVILNEFNLLRDWATKFMAATAAATNLTDLKTRVAALPKLDPRTIEQLKSALGED